MRECSRLVQVHIYPPFFITLPFHKKIDQLITDSYIINQEYQPPSCGPDIREPLYKPTNGHPELSVDTNLANSVLPPPWDYNHHETRVVNLPFRFDPEAPEFVPMANKEEVEQEDDEEVKKKPMVPWLIVGN